ncbi:hypothetical protein [Pseudobacter ginsenosidimutans]|uniref:Uncharacterized protein n=1 Tax=Pseudobacter ginsenosidimutans TaxID=661488 RepID=A0A4Q7N568_9BACT|nr:hypothetical protein [Pseudobacter ginsenosidimutans]QEC44688.1 efflux RND transporter periplasmic adaptor subunit [Pseudobacter ginsenosidimutans]RZS76168.1 hypothetical protein EV199_2047 [Pseudobacter ginsenosidimutans]
MNFRIIYIVLFLLAGASIRANDSLRVPAFVQHALPDSAISGKSIFTLADSVKVKEVANAAVQKVDDLNKWLETLQPDDLNELPIGLKRTISNVTYKLAISSAIFHETFAELTIFAKVEIPQSPGQLFFGVSGLKLSYKGGIIGDAKLCLLGNVPININGGNSQVILKGGFNLNKGQAADDLTFLSMDCNGFKEMGIAADVVFPRSLLIPCDQNGEQITDTKVQVAGSFKSVVSDWNDMLVAISLPKFQISGLDGFVFTVTNAVFDFSDTRNSSSIIFPQGYELRHMSYPNPNMWRGVYVQMVEVMLPKAFKKKDANARVSFGAHDLIVDNNGVSGLFYGKNILSYSSGSASGWKFSVDELSIGIEANRLVAAGFKGNIGLPVADKDSLSYEAVVTQDNKYWLTVSPKGQLDFKLWQAQCTLDSNSYVRLLVDNGEFMPEANLYGRLTINATTKPEGSKAIASFKGVTFRGLRLRTKNPYFSVDYFGYEGEVKVGNFPVSIDNISLVANNTHADLAFGLKLTLQDNAFKASTRLNIGADFENSNGTHRWKLDKVRLESIRLDNVKIGGLTLRGEVHFMEDDPVYGDGFAGGINATFSALNLEVQVRAIFGRTSFRYWFVDGLARWSPGIPVVGPVMINGFAGGAYYHMSKMNSFAGISKNLMPEYKPDNALGLGIKAGVLFCVTSPEVVNARAEFEVAFNNGGGIRYMGFFGNADIMRGVTDAVGEELEQAKQIFANGSSKEAQAMEGMTDEQKQQAIAAEQELRANDPQTAAQEIPCSIGGPNFKGLSAYVGMSYDFQNRIFQSNFELYLNIANVLTGVGENYRAGWSEMYFAPGDWHVYMGTPNNPVGIRFGLGGFSLETSSYFMMGTKIPGSPPPPGEVADILGLDMKQLDYMRDLNSLGEGRGFATGARLKVQTGDLTFLILYANFKAGLGFDLMLKQYKDAHCEGSSEPIGINGWYGNAQAYVFLQGELGVKVNLKFIKFRFPIIQGAAATLLQAKLPNPSWFAGYLGVKFNILGGLVKGNMSFKLTIGKECKIVQGNGKEAVVGMAVISDISPKDTVNTDVFTAPQVAFNFAIDKDIPIQDDEGNKTFRVQLEQFNLVNNGKSIPGEIRWNSNKDVATFYSTEILPSKTSVKATVRVSFKELKNGSWQTVYTDGQKAEESKILEFTTGTAPEAIPLNNIEYSWPVVDQRNFYKDETVIGYVQLKRGQTYLFRIPGYRQELSFVAANGGQPITLPFQYDSVARRLSFNVIKLKTDQQYKLIMSSAPIGSSASGSTTQQSTTDENGLELTNRTASNVARTDIAKTILEYEFVSSRFGKFADRMNSYSLTSTRARKLSSDLISFTQGVANAEAFDLAELSGTDYTAGIPLVQPVAVTTDDYFNKDMYPLLYAGLPYGDITVSDRDTAEYGLIPLRALPVSPGYLWMIENGNYADPQVTQWLPYVYDLPSYYKSDFHDVQNQLVNRYLGTPLQKDYEKIINGYYPFIRQGIYSVNYQFVLPGGAKGSSFTVPYRNDLR